MLLLLSAPPCFCLILLGTFGTCWYLLVLLGISWYFLVLLGTFWNFSGFLGSFYLGGSFFVQLHVSPLLSRLCLTDGQQSWTLFRHANLNAAVFQLTKSHRIKDLLRLLCLFFWRHLLVQLPSSLVHQSCEIILFSRVDQLSSPRFV